MDPYQQRDRVIELLTAHSRKENTTWIVSPPYGMETFVLIDLPGPQKLSLHIEYAKRSDDLDDTRDISGIHLLRRGSFVECVSLGFKVEEGIYKNEIRNIPKLINRINLLSAATKDLVDLKSDCSKVL